MGIRACLAAAAVVGAACSRGGTAPSGTVGDASAATVVASHAARPALSADAAADAPEPDDDAADPLEREGRASGLGGDGRRRKRGVTGNARVGDSSRGLRQPAPMDRPATYVPETGYWDHPARPRRPECRSTHRASSQATPSRSPQGPTDVRRLRGQRSPPSPRALSPHPDSGELLHHGVRRACGTKRSIRPRLSLGTFRARRPGSSSSGHSPAAHSACACRHPTDPASNKDDDWDRQAACRLPCRSIGQAVRTSPRGARQDPLGRPSTPLLRQRSHSHRLLRRIARRGTLALGKRPRSGFPRALARRDTCRRAPPPGSDRARPGTESARELAPARHRPTGPAARSRPLRAKCSCSDCPRRSRHRGHCGHFRVVRTLRRAARTTRRLFARPRQPPCVRSWSSLAVHAR
jgi:hypothetical protein